MSKRTTIDHLSQWDVFNHGDYSCAYMSDGEHGIEVFFESEPNHPILLKEMNENDDPEIIPDLSNENNFTGRIKHRRRRQR
ncbi:hypothetical protein CCP3SC1_1610006 [Gammaproteobacteria bacterium]